MVQGRPLALVFQSASLFFVPLFEVSTVCFQSSDSPLSFCLKHQLQEGRDMFACCFISKAQDNAWHLVCAL